MHKIFIDDVQDICKYEIHMFKHFSYARYATDVMFQQSHRPLKTLVEVKNPFSAKHKNYAIKTKVADIEIFKEIEDIHRHCLEKTEQEIRSPETKVNRE